MNAHIIMNDGSEEVFGITLEDGVVIDFSRDAFESPTVRFYANEATLRELIATDNPTGEFIAAFGNGRIRYEPASFFRGLMFNIGSFFANIFAGGTDSCELNVGVNQQFQTITAAFEQAELLDCDELVIELYPGEYEEGYTGIRSDTVIRGQGDKNQISLVDTQIESIGGHKLEMSDITLEEGSRIRSNNRNAETYLTDMTIRQGKNFGVRQHGGFLEMVRVVIIDTEIVEETIYLPNTGTVLVFDPDQGGAILLTNRAEAVLEDIQLRDNAGGALRMSDRGTVAHVDTVYISNNNVDSETIITDVEVDKRIDTFENIGVVEVRNRAKLLMENAEFENNQFIGLLILNGARAHVRDVEFSGTKEIQVGSTLYGGSNIVVKQNTELLGETGDAELELHDFLSTDAEGGGLVLYGGLVVGADGNITGNDVGVLVEEIEGVVFEPDCISDNVYLYDNTLDFYQSELQLPDPDSQIMQQGQQPADEPLCASVPWNCNWCD